jgi:hypothetical protein
MHLLFLDWGFSLESVARVAAWSVIVAFFWSVGCAIFGFVAWTSRHA